MPPFQAGEQELVTRAGVVDAPPESGNFDGGFAASALQAQAYARHRRDESSRQITTLQLHGAVAPLALAIGAPAAVWESAVRQFLVAELRVPDNTVTVTQLAGGASGDAVFRVRVGRHERIFKVFANNQALNELAQLQYIAGLHLEEFHAVQGHVGTQAAVGANRAGALMESAVGTSIEEMIAHLPPASTLRNAHIDRIMRSSRRVADGLAELHAVTHNGFQSRAQKDGPGSSAHAILNVKLPAIQVHLAPHYATIVGRFTQAVQQYVASNVPAVAYHGDANAGNFILDGDDVRAIDVGAMQWSRGPHGATGTGANDLARFITSIETLRPGALQPNEVALIRTAFLDRYHEQCAARGLQVQPDDLRAAVKIFRVETEIAVLNAAIRRLGPVPAAHLVQPVAASGRDRILSALQ